MSEDKPSTTDKKNKKERLGRTVIQGSLWMFAGKWIVRGLRFFMRVVLARLLAPAAFGIVASAEAVIGFFKFSSELGQKDAALYYQDRDDYPETSCSFVFILRMLFYGLLFISAPWLVQFLNFDMPAVYSDQDLIQILRVLGLTLLIGSVQFYAGTVLKKELKFHVLSIGGMAGTVVTVPMAIYLARENFGFWSLVYPALAGLGTTTVITVTAAFRHIRFRMRWPALKTLIRYGAFPFLGGLFMYMNNNFDDLIVGKLTGLEMLGFYWMAYSLGIRMISDLTSPLEQVIFPVLTRLKDDLARFRKRFIESWGYVSLIAIPAGTGLYLISESITIVGFSAKWKPMIPALKIFSVYVVLKLVGGWKANVFNGLGKPVYSFLSSVGFLVLCLGSMYYTVMSFGIAGAALSFLGARVVMFVVTLFVTARLLNSSNITLLIPHAKPLICSAIMAFVLLLLRSVIQTDTITGLITMVLTGVASYTIPGYFLMKKRVQKIIEILQSNSEFA